MKSSLPAYFATCIPVEAPHTKDTRFRNLNSAPFTNKNYCKECVRYGIVKLVNSIKIGPSGVDTSIYETNFKYDKILSKQTKIISDILDKIYSHSFEGFGYYIKTRFFENYTVLVARPRRNSI